MELMQTLDDAWNAQDVATFEQRHRRDAVVRWPGKPPTHGIEAHNQEALDFFRAFDTGGARVPAPAPAGLRDPRAGPHFTRPHTRGADR